MRALRFLALLALTSCHRDAVPGDNSRIDLSIQVADLAATGLADLASTRPRPDFGDICGGGYAPTARLNDTVDESTTTVHGMTVPLDCCDAATLEWDSPVIGTRLILVWRHLLGQVPDTPVGFELDDPDPGWSTSLFSGCNPFADPDCVPTDRYDTGLSGSIAIDGHPGGWTVAVCLHATEGATAHPVIHDAELWASGMVVH